MIVPSFVRFVATVTLPFVAVIIALFVKSPVAYKLSIVGILMPSIQRYTLCTQPSPRYSCTSFCVIPRISMILRRLTPVSRLLIKGNIGHLPLLVMLTLILQSVKKITEMDMI